MSEDEGDGYDPHDDVPEWTDEDEERYQARRREELRRRHRRQRQGWSFALLVLVVLGAGVGGAGIIQGWWEWPFGREPAEAGESPTCPAGVTPITAPADVRVRVLNATDIRGLAGAVGTELGKRGYVVDSVGNDESDVDVLESAQVRYGTAMVADAQSVALHVPGAVLVDDGRTSEIVDLVVGQGYRNVSSAEEAAAAIAAAAAPEGCVPAAPSPSATTPPPTTTG